MSAVVIGIVIIVIILFVGIGGVIMYNKIQFDKSEKERMNRPDDEDDEDDEDEDEDDEDLGFDDPFFEGMDDDENEDDSMKEEWMKEEGKDYVGEAKKRGEERAKAKAAKEKEMEDSITAAECYAKHYSGWNKRTDQYKETVKEIKKSYQDNEWYLDGTDTPTEWLEKYCGPEITEKGLKTYNVCPGRGSQETKDKEGEEYVGCYLKKPTTVIYRNRNDPDNFITPLHEMPAGPFACDHDTQKVNGIQTWDGKDPGKNQAKECVWDGIMGKKET